MSSYTYQKFHSGAGEGQTSDWGRGLHPTPPPLEPLLSRSVNCRFLLTTTTTDTSSNIETSGVDAGAVRVQVKVMVRVCPVEAGRSSLLTCSEHLHQVTLHDQSVVSATTSPAAAPRRRTAAPKTFAFDAVFTHDTSLVSTTLYY